MLAVLRQLTRFGLWKVEGFGRYRVDAAMEAVRKAFADAEAVLAAWLERWSNYSGNNCNRYRADIKRARFTVASAKERLAWLEGKRS